MDITAPLASEQVAADFRANGQNLVAAIVCCVSNESEIAAQQEKQKLRNRCHGVPFLASQAEMQLQNANLRGAAWPGTKPRRHERNQAWR